MKKPAGFLHPGAGIFALVLFVLNAVAAEPDPVVPATPPAVQEQEATNAVAAPPALSPQVIEQLRREIEQSAVRNAEAITSSLSLIEPTLNRLHERQMEAVQSSNRTILIVAGIFAAVGFLGLIFITLILVRAIGRFSELAVLSGSRGQLVAPGQTNALGQGDLLPGKMGAAEQATGRFQSAIEQLQKRIIELEQSAQSPPPVSAGQGSRRPATTSAHFAVPNLQPLPPHSAGLEANSEVPAGSRASLLLGKGQALLNLDAAEPALQCFDEALALEPQNADAFVKKGMALEKLQDWEQALENYDRAIAIDNSLTVAHLYRGGVCNRLQRHREALESYEHALRSEKSSRAS